MCMHGDTALQTNQSIKNRSKNENVNTIPDHFLKAHNARRVQQYARARLCRVQFCDDDERLVSITGFLPINDKAL